MRKFTFFILVLSGILSLVFSYSSVMAQSNNPCGTDDILKEQIKKNPQVLQWMQDFDKYAENFKVQNKTDGGAPTFIIPIVFHVIHNYGPENISDAQVIDAVRILNNDFRKLNADTNKIVSAFTSIAADAKIEFRLARLDPNGNCTNGIDRVASSKTYAADDNSKLNSWPRDKYLNVWTVSTIGTAGVAGYAYYASSNPSAAVDGIIILSDYIGSIGTSSAYKSRALTHEIGHSFNLQHVWGSTNNPEVSCGNDGVSDTPLTKGHSSACLLTDQTCTSGVTENVQNYMEYAYCSCMYTAGQVTRMTACLNATAASRNNLSKTANLQATGVVPQSTCVPKPKADFKAPNIPVIICQGAPIKFTDISWNGHPTSWKWTFTGGTPSISTDSMPTITYSMAGTYNVKLVVANSAGKDSITKTSYVTVKAINASNTGSFSEGFEGGAIPATWTVNKSSTIQWQYTNAAAATGTSSVRVVNTSASSNQNTQLLMEMVDLSKITTPKLYYKFSSAQRSSTSIDTLKVYISTDCGVTWDLRKSIKGTTLSKAGVVTSNFVPTANQWYNDSISLSIYATETHAQFKFYFGSGGGNYIYLDDINIRTPGSPTGILNLVPEGLDFNIFPNPMDNSTTVSFNLTEKSAVALDIYDLLGRKVKSVLSNASSINSGEYKIPVNKDETLRPGIYFVRMTIADQQITKRLVIN